MCLQRATPLAPAAAQPDYGHMTNTLLCFGYGYTARALARILPDWTIIGTSRDGEGDTLKWPGSDMSEALARATHLLISIAPTEAGDPVLNVLANDIAAAPNLKWVGYLSTTGVYGDHQGDWVDEDTTLAPTTKRGELRVLAEQQWQKQSLSLHIFRLAGIYGPGRGPFTKVRNGTARRIIKPGQVFSRAHVDDIAQTLAASIAHPKPGAIYNVCDDDPAPPEDVIGFAAELLDIPAPESEEFATAEMTPMARSFYAESKKVRNDRIKNELGVKLKYADYRTGLKALLAEES